MRAFIEPKGTGFMPGDSWKEKALLELEANAIPITKFADDNDYKIWELHFFNRERINAEFADDMSKT